MKQSPDLSVNIRIAVRSGYADVTRTLKAGTGSSSEGRKQFDINALGNAEWAQSKY